MQHSESDQYLGTIPGKDDGKSWKSLSYTQFQPQLIKGERKKKTHVGRKVRMFEGGRVEEKKHVEEKVHLWDRWTRLPLMTRKLTFEELDETKEDRKMASMPNLTRVESIHKGQTLAKKLDNLITGNVHSGVYLGLLFKFFAQIHTKTMF